MIIDTNEVVAIIKSVQDKGKGAVISSYILTCIDTVCEAIIKRIHDYEEKEGEEIAGKKEQ